MFNSQNVRRLLLVIVAGMLLLSFSVSAAQSGDNPPPAPPDGDQEGAPPSGNPPGAPPDGVLGGGMGAGSANPVLTTECGDFLVDSDDLGTLEDQTYDTTTGDVSAVCHQRRHADPG